MSTHAGEMPRGALARALDERGQMAVELAVLIPVILVVGLTIYNLMRFTELCALFDRVALDAVISQGVSPSGAQCETAAVGEVQACIEESLGSDRVEVLVAASSAREGAPQGSIAFPISPLLTKFTCTMRYRPWPGSFVMAGVRFESPLALTHERTLVVDRFRPGVVV